MLRALSPLVWRFALGRIGLDRGLLVVSRLLATARMAAKTE
jgi:hypothetical protein